MITEIIPNLFIGAWPDQNLFGGAVLNVLEQPPEREHSLWVPILDPKNFVDLSGMAKAGVPLDDQHFVPRREWMAGDEAHVNIEALLLCRGIITLFQRQRRRLLVHCGAGIERSPLTVAFWMVHSMYLTRDFDEAYAFLQSKRPIVMDRRAWLPQEWQF